MAKTEKIKEIELPPIPWADNALEPYISERTISFHYGKHHRTYVENTNKLIKDTEFAGLPLEEIVVKTAGKPEYASIFNNASQSWNHTFFWNSMEPGGGGTPSGKLAEMINRTFGSFDKFREEFASAALTQFGSGWAWLAIDNGVLKVTKTSNADSPLAHGQTPLITIDVWEHAYYLDYQNRRKDFIDAYLNNLVNWDFAEENLKKYLDAHK